MCTSCFKQVQICKVERIKVKMGIGRWRLKIFVVFLRAVIFNPISLAPTVLGICTHTHFFTCGSIHSAYIQIYKMYYTS